MTETRYEVHCEQCGRVEFDVLDRDWFGNKTAATWYSGYHGGKEHPEASRQFGYVKEVTDQPWQADILDNVNESVRILEGHGYTELAAEVGELYQKVGRETLD